MLHFYPLIASILTEMLSGPHNLIPQFFAHSSLNKSKRNQNKLF